MTRPRNPGRIRRWVWPAAVSLGTLALGLAVADLGFRRAARPLTKMSIATGYYGHSGPVGRSVPPPGDYRFNLETAAGERLYDVVYTIDRHGHRVTRGGGEGAETYLFFGGSVTFGEGVANSETLPQRFSEALGYRFTVVNASFHGYGPQQMLRALELGQIDEAITGPVRHVVYLAIPTHPERVAGDWFWNLDTPRYELDARGQAGFVGMQSEHWPTRLLATLDRAGGLPQRLARAAYALESEDARNRLWAAVVERSASIARDRYGSKFLCVLWDQWDPGRPAELERLLVQRNIETFRVAPVLAGLTPEESLIRSGVDHHPSARAHGLLGFALARYLTEGAPRSE